MSDAKHADTPEWQFAYLMPHTDFDAPIGHGPVAIVRSDDPRLTEIASRSEAVKKLVTSFTDQFGEAEVPSAILVRSDALPKIDFYAIASFRNAVAISSMIEAAAFVLVGGSAGYPRWSDYFDLYAYTVTRDDNLKARSVASSEVNEPGQFVGQRAPQIASSRRVSFGVDADILKRCVHLWDRRFVKNRQEFKSRVLFRALEIAFQANRVPAVGNHVPTIHDLGTSIALWVSAFEVLSRMRGGTANVGAVIDLLEEFEFDMAQLRKKRRSIKYGGKSYALNWVQELYWDLYKARNDFLHGNPVSKSSLYPAHDTKKPSLLTFAPLVFKAALAVLLPQPRVRKPKNVEEQIAQHVVSHQSITRFERALLGQGRKRKNKKKR